MRVKRLINHFICEEMNELNKRGIKYGHGTIGAYNKFTSKCFDTDTDIEIDGVWREAIKICILRTMSIPRDIVNDFMITKGLWEE